jgi:hypothetical protein
VELQLGIELLFGERLSPDATQPTHFV